jgi:tetratricopeptide (TPR) repeat protein
MQSMSSCSYKYFFLLSALSSIACEGFCQPLVKNSFEEADSCYLAKSYTQAKAIYKRLMTDTSQDALHWNRFGYSEYSTGNFNLAEKYYLRALASNPVPLVKASALSRIARICALQNKEKEATDYLDSAINAGYIAIKEIDTVKDFNRIRNAEGFKQVRNKLFAIIYPCANDPHAREFDFWVGEWNVYVTGTNNLVGNSVIQKISGGCAILENWTSSVSEGKSLNFVDDSTKKWKQVWVGSYSGGKQDFVNGEYKDRAMRFTFETKDAQGHLLKGRFIFFNIDPNTVRQFNETSLDEGKNWTTSYDFTYIRKK